MKLFNRTIPWENVNTLQLPKTHHHNTMIRSCKSFINKKCDISCEQCEAIFKTNTVQNEVDRLMKGV